MARGRYKDSGEEKVMSIVGPGMTVVGDCKSTGSIRVEGVVDGTIQSDKGVVIGKGACVNGDVTSQEGVIAGTVNGTVRVEGRLEFHATGIVEGELHTGLLQLEEGGKINGAIKIGQMTSGPKAVDGPHAAVAGTSAVGRAVEDSPVVKKRSRAASIG